MEAASGFDDEARAWLQRASTILAPRAEELVDKWRSVTAAHPDMARVFFGPDGQPDEGYKAAVKKRFVQWVIDACERPHDRAWLAYQEEVGKRQTPDKKNQTDHAQTPSVVPLRYLIAFSAIIWTTLRPFLEGGGCNTSEIQSIQDAWTKSMLLHLALWSRPYVANCVW